MLDRLWEADGPLGVRDLCDLLSGRPRAYTTVMTILTRLIEKGLVRRMPAGRSFVYEPAGSEDELAAEAIGETLRRARDPEAVLAHFVDEISDDPRLLRRLREIVGKGRR